MHKIYILPTQCMYVSIDSITVLNYLFYNGACVRARVCVCVCVCVLCGTKCSLSKANVNFRLHRVKHAK
jgi:hypothetical protein